MNVNEVGTLYVKCPCAGLAESVEDCAGYRKLLISNPAYTFLYFFFLFFFLAHSGFIFRRILFSL